MDGMIWLNGSTLYWILFIGISIASWVVSRSVERKIKKYAQEPLPMTGAQVAEKMLRDNDIEMEVTENAIGAIAKAGFDPEFGARPVKRALQKELLNELSKKMLSGEVNRDSKIVVDAEGEHLVFHNK